jgi:hypothetical protein
MVIQRAIASTHSPARVAVVYGARYPPTSAERALEAGSAQRYMMSPWPSVRWVRWMPRTRPTEVRPHWPKGVNCRRRGWSSGRRDRASEAAREPVPSGGEDGTSQKTTSESWLRGGEGRGGVRSRCEGVGLGVEPHGG